MVSIRALMGVAVVSLVSCSPPYEGAQCRSIDQLTDPATLPLGPSAQITASDLNQSASYFNYTHELACCITNPSVKDKGDCSDVTCSEVIAKTTIARASFMNDPCGTKRGNSVCLVFTQGSKVVGVYAQCQD